MKRVRIALLLVAALILLLLFYLFVPTAPNFPANPTPAQSYDDALARFEKLRSQESNALFPECHTQLYSHGTTVTRTIVFFHGISNCPAQFATLGQQFYELGYNVLIPRLPHHGWADRMTTDIANLTAQELVATADEAADIAVGLGEEVTVVGFSTGGALAGWLAMARSDVDQAVLTSAFLSPKGYNPALVRPMARGLLWLPNQFWWWDPELQENLPGPRYAYARYPSHAIAQILQLGFAVRAAAQHSPPKSDKILVIMNDGPRESVDNRVTHALIENWRAQGGNVASFEFPAELDLDHDYVSMEAPNQPVDLFEEVYPVLIEQIQGMDQQ